MDNNAAVPVAIGNIPTAAGGERPFDGLIDEVRVYDRALSAEEISQVYRYALGKPGSMVFNDSRDAIEYCNGTDWVMAGLGSYTPNAVTFDGTSDYLVQSGASYPSSKIVSGSFWVRKNSTATTFRLYEAGGNDFVIFLESDGSVDFVAKNTGGSYVLLCDQADLGLNDMAWHHIMFSFDLSDSNKKNLYVDDANVTPGSCGAYVDDFMTPQSSVYLGRDAGGTIYFDGEIGDFWMDFGTYIDFSQAENRRKFIADSGMAMYLGQDGSLPTGHAPDIFLSGDTANWHTNDGTGGGFTENGALTDADSAPGDVYYSSNSTLMDGLIGWWKLDETSGTTAYDSSTTGNDGTYLNGVTPAAQSVSGVFGRAIDFGAVGGNNIVTAPNDPVYDAMGSGFTYAACIRPHAFGGHMGLIEQTGLLNFRFEWNSNNLTLKTLAWSGSDTNWRGVSTGITVDKWYHVAVTYDPTSTTNDPVFYVNGAATAINTFANPSGTFTNPGTSEANVGRGVWNGSYNAFKGDLDDARIYSRVLSAAEIAQLYNQGVCASPTRLNGTIIYNADQQVLQYCDSAAAGNGWKAMGPVPGTGTGGCSNPTKAEGSLIFNKDFGLMQYCDGDNWVKLGKPPEKLVWQFDADGTSAGTGGCAENVNGVAGTVLSSPDCDQTVGAASGDGARIALAGNGSENVRWAYPSAVNNNLPYWAEFTLYVTSFPSSSPADVTDIRSTGGLLRLPPRITLDSTNPGQIDFLCNFNGGYQETVSSTISAGTLYTIWMSDDGVTNNYRICNGSTVVDDLSCASNGNLEVGTGRIQLGNGNATSSAYDFTIDNYRIYTGQHDKPCQ